MLTNMTYIMRLFYLKQYKFLLLSLCTFLSIAIPATMLAQRQANLSVTVNVADVICHGDANGIITANPDGGAPPYIFNWSNGETTQTISGLSAGIYSVTVTDQVGATATASGTVSEPPAIGLQMDANYETCDGSADAHAGVQTSGGTPPFTFLWSDGQTSFIAENLSAGDYTVTVTDANGCTAIGEITVELSPEGIWLMTSSTPPSCNGGDDGTAHVSVMTGTAPFIIIWSDGQTGEDPVGLSAGTYFVTVTDVNGCTNSDQVTVTDPPEVGGFANTTDNTDCDNPNGSINLSAFGGTPGYTYSWNTGATTSSISDLSGGNYAVTITDANGCTNVVTATINDDCPPACPPDAGTLTPDATPVCLDGQSVTISATPDGNMIVPAGYEVIYVLTSGPGLIIQQTNASPSFTVSATGNYTIHTLVYDPNTLDINSITIGVTTGFDVNTLLIQGGGTICASLDVDGAKISVVDNCNGECTEPVIRDIVVIEANCGAADGKAFIDIAGNPADFIIVWSPNVSNGFSATGLANGTYSVTITDANDPACTVNETFAVGTVGGPEAEVVQTTLATCNETNGTATVSPFGFTYEWCNGGTGNNVTNLPAGTCTVTVTDPATGCTNVIEVEIDTFNPLTAEATINQQPDCNMANGSVTIVVSFGSFNYSYDWSDGGTGETRNDLAAGVYEVTVTDNGATGCTAIVNFVLTDNVPGATVTVDPIAYTTCPGDTDASVNIDVTLSPGFATPETVIITDVSGNIYTNGNLGAGSYCIVVTDANGCVAGGACFEVVDRERIDVDVELINEECVVKGSITLKVNGGVAPYTFDWADLPGTADPQDRTDLSSGTYHLTITDANGCEAIVNDLLIDDNCSCAIPVIESVVVIEASCTNSDGQATINLSGNPADYVYSWAPPVSPTNQAFNIPGGVYSITIADVNDANCFIVEEFTVGNTEGPEAAVSTTPANCVAADGSISLSPADYTYNWSDGFVGSTRAGLVSGRYFIEVIDPANPDCPDYITVNLTSTNNLEADVIVDTTPNCGNADGAVSLSASGGSADYTFEWADGFTGAIRTDLSSGVYEVKVIDNIAGCQTDLSFVLADNVPNATVVINTDPVMTSCPASADGTVNYDITYAGGFAQPATIQIVNGDGELFINGSLSPGIYCAVVRDANNCVAGGDCFRVVAPDQIDLDLAPFDATCDELASILVTDIQGGAGGYIFDWQDLIGTNDPLDRMDLAAGSYTCVVTDANGCNVNASVGVEGSSMPEAAFSFQYDACDEGQVLVSFTDLSSTMNNIGITQEWNFSNGASSNNSNPTVTINSSQTLDAQLIITAADGCVDTASASLVVSLIDVNMQDSVISCFGASVALNPSANTNYTYEWSPALGLNDPTAANPTANPAQTTTYTVQITNFAGADTCQIVKEVMVIVPDAFTVEAPEDFMTCQEETSLQANSSGNVTLTWYDAQGDSIGNTPQVIVPVPDDTFFYIVGEDGFGCTLNDTVSVEEGSVNFEIQGSLFACENTTAQVTAVNLDIEDILTYNWTPSTAIEAGATTASPILNTSQAGPITLYVEVTNQFNCTSIDSITVGIIDTSLNAAIIADAQCEEGLINFSVDGVDLTYYTWNFGDLSNPNDTATGQNVSYTYPDTGFYTVTLTLPDGADCPTDSVMTEIYVAPGPIFSLDYDYTVESCADTAVLVFNDLSTLTTNDSIISWDWTFSTSQTADVKSPTIIVYESQELIFELELETANGCTETISDTISIEVIDLTPPADQEACPNDVVSLNPNPNTDYTYQWSPGDQLSDPNAPNPSVTATETTTYMVTVSNGSGCSVEEEVMLEVRSNLDGFGVAANDTTTCDNEAITIGANGNVGVSFEWFDANGSIGSGSMIELAPGAPTDPNVYQVIATDQFGCTASDTVSVVDYSVQFNFTGPPFTACEGKETEILTEIALAPGEIVSYSWSPSNIIVDLSDEAAPIISTSESVTLVVEVSNQFGCMTRDSADIIVSDLANTLNITAEPDETCERGAEIELNVTSAPGYEYVWSPAETLDRTDVSNPIARPEETTEYVVMVTDENGCMATSRITITVIDPECTEEFVFFPNAFTPNGDSKNDILRVRGISLDEVYFVIYNRWGEKVFESFSKNDGWDGTFKGKQLSSDVFGYYLRVRCFNGEFFTKKGNVSLIR